MQKINYGKKLEKLITNLNTVPRLMLHSCCAPCSSYVLEYLSRYFSIYLLYYNPNIAPMEEYERRRKELFNLISEMPFANEVKIIEEKYNPEFFYQVIKGLEEETEGGLRCMKCYEMRMKEAAIAAKENNCDYFTTTLSISPMKDAQKINDIGERISEIYGVKHLPSDFKKKGGYKRSIELSREYQLYRQDFCGCIFSKRQRERQKEQLKDGSR